MTDIQPDMLTDCFTVDDLTWESGRTIYEWWSAQAASGKIPARKDFEPMKFAKYLPYISLIDTTDKRDKFHVRLIGTALTQAMGYDPTGDQVSTFKGSEEIYKRYNAVIDSKKPHMMLKTSLFWANKDYIHYHILYLPLSDDGETVNMLLVAIQFNKK